VQRATLRASGRTLTNAFPLPGGLPSARAFNPFASAGAAGGSLTKMRRLYQERL
jgi:hypothetical protein